VSASSPEAGLPPGSPHSAGLRAKGAAAAAPGTGSPSLSAKPPGSDDEAGSRRSPARVLKDIGLFFASPFVTLAYLALFPFIGMKLLIQAWRDRKAAA
jgi:hypothetical protein